MIRQKKLITSETVIFYLFFNRRMVQEKIHVWLFFPTFSTLKTTRKYLGGFLFFSSKANLKLTVNISRWVSRMSCFHMNFSVALGCDQVSTDLVEFVFLSFRHKNKKFNLIFIIISKKIHMSTKRICSCWKYFIWVRFSQQNTKEKNIWVL